MGCWRDGWASKILNSQSLAKKKFNAVWSITQFLLFLYRGNFIGYQQTISITILALIILKTIKPLFMERTGEIVMYQAADGKMSIDVKLENETVWLSLVQISSLFEKDKSVISRHL